MVKLTFVKYFLNYQLFKNQVLYKNIIDLKSVSLTHHIFLKMLENISFFR